MAPKGRPKCKGMSKRRPKGKPKAQGQGKGDSPPKQNMPSFTPNSSERF